MATTVYDVNVRYGLTDQASKKIGLIEDRAKGAAKATGGLGRSLRFLAGGAVAGLAFREAKRHLIDYNANLERTAIGLRGIMMMSGISDGIQEAKEDADKLFTGLKQDAKASVGELEDFTAMASSLAGPVGKAGLGMEQLRSITQGAVVASQALGIEAGQAALDIEQALAGTMSSKDRFARMLGLDSKAVNKMDAKKRAEAVLKALNQPAVKQMAKEFENSFAGQSSTLTDNLKQALGKVGLPLMKRITVEIKSWNEWLDKNQDKVAAWANRFGDALVDGFNAVKSAIKWVIAHRDTLLSLAKAFLAFKGAKMVGGMAGTMFEGLASLSKWSFESGKGLAGFARSLGSAAGALGAFYFSLKGIAGEVDRAQEESIGKRVAVSGFLDHASRLKGISPTFAGDIAARRSERTQEMERAARLGLEQARMNQLVDGGGKVNRAKLKDMMGLVSARGQGEQFSQLEMQGRTGFARDQLRVANEQTKALDQAVRALELMVDVERAKDRERGADAQYKLLMGLVDVWDMRMKERNIDFLQAGTSLLSDALGAFGAWAGQGAKKKPKKAPTNINVKVNKIEITSDDPDRIAFGLVSSFQDLASNPTQSRRVIPGLREG